MDNVGIALRRCSVVDDAGFDSAKKLSIVENEDFSGLGSILEEEREQ